MTEIKRFRQSKTRKQSLFFQSTEDLSICLIGNTGSLSPSDVDKPNSARSYPSYHYGSPSPQMSRPL